MKKIAVVLNRFMPFVFICSIIANTILSLIPTTSIPTVFVFWDKAQHAISFSILAVIGSVAYPKRWKTVFWGLIFYGAIIEVMQAAITSTRFGEPFDLIADIIGVVAGTIFYSIIFKR